MLFVYLSDEYLLGMLAWLVAMAVALRFMLRKRLRHRKESRPTRWIDISLIAWMFCALMTVCELGFALFVDHSDAFNMTNVSKRWFQIHIEQQRNEFGARDVEPFEKSLASGQKRIVFIGDSFTVGHGIDDMANRFSDQVAAKLESKKPGQYNVANLADPGLETSQIEARIHGLFNEGYQVDSVIYVMCLNDIEGYDEETQKMIAKVGSKAPTSILFSKTYFFNWLYYRYLQFTQPEMGEYFPNLKSAYQGVAWVGLRNKLDELHERCRSHKADFRMVLFPFVQNLGDDYPLREVHQQMVDYCEKNSIPVLDLEPVLRPHADENLTVNPFDAHPNERAHQLAADAIFEKLLDDY